MKFKNTSNAMKPSLISAKTNETLVSSFLTFVSKVINMVLPIKDVNDLQKELANDHLIMKELSAISGSLYLACGRLTALRIAAFITAKYIVYDAGKMSEPQQAAEQKHQIKLNFFTFFLNIIASMATNEESQKDLTQQFMLRKMLLLAMLLLKESKKHAKNRNRRMKI